MFQTADVQFNIRDYRGADFDRLWEIDQLCFPQGIAYTQMELSGFITRRNAITIVAELSPALDQQLPNLRSPVDRLGSGASFRAATLQEPKQMDHIVGFLVAHPIRKIGRILTLDVVPNARQAGLGSQLLGECEQRLQSCGCSKVYLETAVNNEGAIQLYRKFGYQILSTLPDYYPSHSLDAFLLGKDL